MMKKKLPPWFKQEIPDSKKFRELKILFNSSGLNTVCKEAKCPNISICWKKNTATFMISGKICTRNCRFCSVETGLPHDLNPQESENIALAVKKISLKYVVITSVTRDDLIDEGASQFVKTILSIRQYSPDTKVEVLIPDFSFQRNILENVVNSKPDVMGHNIEMVKRIFRKIRIKGDYDRSLAVLENIKKINPSMIVKSGFMVGLGETYSEVLELIEDLALRGCDILTIGQYLAPTSLKRHLKEERFVNQAEFDLYKRAAEDQGVKCVVAGPKVRSSFLAEDSYHQLRRRDFKNGDSKTSKTTSKF